MTQEEKQKQKQIMLAQLHLIRSGFYGNYKGDVETQRKINKIVEECKKKIENSY